MPKVKDATKSIDQKLSGMVKESAGTSTLSETTVPDFSPLSAVEATGFVQERRVRVPRNRLTPFRNEFVDIVRPLVEHMKLQFKFDERRKIILLRPGPTAEISSLQKGCDYLEAYMVGFAQKDAVALLRLDELYLDSFEIQDVKTLHGDHLSRGIGRIAGKDGSMKYAIENSTKTRVVLAENKVHILGSYQNIALAKDAICSLILGSPPGKVCTLRDDSLDRPIGGFIKSTPIPFPSMSRPNSDSSSESDSNNPYPFPTYTSEPTQRHHSRSPDKDKHKSRRKANPHSPYDLPSTLDDFGNDLVNGGVWVEREEYERERERRNEAEKKIKELMEENEKKERARSNIEKNQREVIELRAKIEELKREEEVNRQILEVKRQNEDEERRKSEQLRREVRDLTLELDRKEDEGKEEVRKLEKELKRMEKDMRKRLDRMKDDLREREEIIREKEIAINELEDERRESKQRDKEKREEWREARVSEEERTIKREDRVEALHLTHHFARLVLSSVQKEVVEFGKDIRREQEENQLLQSQKSNSDVREQSTFHQSIPTLLSLAKKHLKSTTVKERGNVVKALRREEMEEEDKKLLKFCLGREADGRGRDESGGFFGESEEERRVREIEERWLEVVWREEEMEKQRKERERKEGIVDTTPPSDILLTPFGSTSHSLFLSLLPLLLSLTASFSALSILLDEMKQRTADVVRGQQARGRTEQEERLRDQRREEEEQEEKEKRDREQERLKLKMHRIDEQRRKIEEEKRGVEDALERERRTVEDMRRELAEMRRDREKMRRDEEDKLHDEDMKQREFDRMKDEKDRIERDNRKIQQQATRMAEELAKMKVEKEESEKLKRREEEERIREEERRREAIRQEGERRMRAQLEGSKMKDEEKERVGKDEGRRRERRRHDDERKEGHGRERRSRDDERRREKENEQFNLSASKREKWWPEHGGWDESGESGEELYKSKSSRSKPSKRHRH
ncbi:putative Pre-rRNA-processing protein PNO1 [Blattamonas nauphoetae]|uniref:Pre-rRNA-processing protein PNO1 n=1 Tax=Blattamonas nauphoetae TaxID=2049346 RepID=A0ABQ9YF74_9EUKA|nr:putative Pre-rRNA-processing protein PNO1 [Blattamonas nauphoetae]